MAAQAWREHTLPFGTGQQFEDAGGTDVPARYELEKLVAGKFDRHGGRLS